MTNLRDAFDDHEYDRLAREVVRLQQADGDAMDALRAAVRWSLWGKHDGWGAFGAPSHAPVYVMGITHAEFGPWGLRREYTLYDETAIWKQIVMHTG